MIIEFTQCLPKMPEESEADMRVDSADSPFQPALALCHVCLYSHSSPTAKTDFANPDSFSAVSLDCLLYKRSFSNCVGVK